MNIKFNYYDVLTFLLFVVSLYFEEIELANDIVKGRLFLAYIDRLIQWIK